ncbi:hypothetical protein GUITHDRAFT_105234 [Guillardia theta CCMP2712]|uniref:Uncharacterized protein n=1 Tax=Guillardia theta (strain CCMP2712) TaxID=905079 RepID=L1JLY0_GUITC|nr:hypothetical protein GUITHDRAFT_105234 [Guillardia theta CCMP2712]EKX49160.1 hypothetical protein GUITHDRAFT_105234 [Guillardia theta CCMP2712]|eukprot:XP_005836140.1 hypothetical protein GUITHDRAFT_105234 [Guillardia theta CCMP2712]
MQDECHTESEMVCQDDDDRRTKESNRWWNDSSQNRRGSDNSSSQDGSPFSPGSCTRNICFCKLSACFPYSKTKKDPFRVEADFVLVDANKSKVEENDEIRYCKATELPDLSPINEKRSHAICTPSEHRRSETIGTRSDVCNEIARVDQEQETRKMGTSSGYANVDDTMYTRDQIIRNFCEFVGGCSRIDADTLM